MVTTEKAGTVEVHGERLVPFRHLLAGFDDLGDVLVGGVAHKFQGKMNLIGFAPVDVAALMLQVPLETLCERGKLRSARDGYG